MPRRAILAALTLMPMLAVPLRSSLAVAAPPRILAFGDSLTAGYGLPPDAAFPVRLQVQLATAGIATKIINGGVSGDTTAGGVARLDWALADKPDYVLLELGANDALRGIDPKVTFANLDTMLTRILAGGAKVLLCGMKAPANWGSDYRTAFDAIYPRLAEKHKVPLYPFFLDGVVLDSALVQPDGVHPNAKGVDVIVERILPAVERLIAGGSAASAGG